MERLFDEFGPIERTDMKTGKLCVSQLLSFPSLLLLVESLHFMGRARLCSVRGARYSLELA